MFSRRKIHTIEEYKNPLEEHFVNLHDKIILDDKTINMEHLPITKLDLKMSMNFISFNDIDIKEIEIDFEKDIEENIIIPIEETRLNNYKNSKNSKNYSNDKYALYLENAYKEKEKGYNENIKKINTFDNIIKWYYLNDYIVKSQFISESVKVNKDIVYISNQDITISQFLLAQSFAKTILKKFKTKFDTVCSSLTHFKSLYDNVMPNDIDEPKWNENMVLSKTIIYYILYRILVYNIFNHKLCLTMLCKDKDTTPELGLCKLNKTQILNLFNTLEAFMSIINQLSRTIITNYNQIIQLENDLDEIFEKKRHRIANLINGLYEKLYSNSNLILEGFIFNNSQTEAINKKNLIVVKKIDDKYIAFYDRDSRKQQSVKDIEEKIKSNISSGTSYIDLETGEDLYANLKNESEKENFIKKFNESKDQYIHSCSNPTKPNTILKPIRKKGPPKSRYPRKSINFNTNNNNSLRQTTTAGGFSKKYKHKKQTKITKHKNRKSKFKSKSKTNKKH